MALLDEKNFTAEAAKRARFRVHHVGTKLNQAELHELEALAAKRKQTQAELIRGLVLREIEQDQTGLRPSAEMVEITACRLLLVNLLGPLLKGQVVTSELFDGIVDYGQEAEGAGCSGPAQRPRSAALRLGSRVSCDAAAGGQKDSAARKTQRPRERVISHFSAASVRIAGGKSRLCASLRPQRGAKNAALTNLPLRSCVASSYRKNVETNEGQFSDLAEDTIPCAFGAGRAHTRKAHGVR